MKRKLSIFALFIVSIFALGAQNSLKIKVENIENPTGSLYIALFDSKTPFLGKEGKGKIVKIDSNNVEVIYSKLEDGKYAICMFQDENDNGKLDLGEFGIPSEKYGFSNNINPAKIMRQPVFEECMFDINQDTEIVISLKKGIE